MAGIQSTILSHPRLEEIDAAIRAEKPLMTIAREFGVSRDSLFRFRKRRQKQRTNGDPPAPLAHGDDLGERVEALKSGHLGCTYRETWPLLEVSIDEVKQAHRDFQRKRAEEDGSAQRKRQIVLLTEQKQELDRDERKIALTGTAAEHRDITARIRQVEQERDRLEAAQIQFDEDQARTRKRTNDQRRPEIDKGLKEVQGSVDQGRDETERLIRAAMVSFQKMHAWANIGTRLRHERNQMDGAITHPLIGVPPDALWAFVKGMKGENKR